MVFIYLFNYLFIHLFIHILIYLLTYLFIHSFIYLFTHLFTYLLIYSFTYSLMYLFIPYLKHLLFSDVNWFCVLFLCYRGMVDESGDQFVAYFLPTEETLKKRKQDEMDNIDYEEGQEWVLMISLKGYR